MTLPGGSQGKEMEKLVEEICEQLGAMTSTLVRYRERGDKEAAHEWKMNVSKWLITRILQAVADGEIDLPGHQLYLGGLTPFLLEHWQDIPHSRGDIVIILRPEGTGKEGI